MAKLQKFFSSLNPRKIANIRVVALCFFAATTFWVLNALNKDNYFTVVDYPIEIIYDQAEFMAVDKLPNRLKVEINGNGWDLLRKYFKVNEAPFLIEIDNPAANNYLLTSELRRSLAETMNPTSLVAILSDTINFNIDKVVTRKIKLEVDTTKNTLAKNHFLAGPIETDPTVVDVTGPTSILQQLDGVLKVELGEVKINRDFNKIIPLLIPEEYEPYLSLEEESVHVKFTVVQFLEGNKRLKLRLDNFPKNVTLAQEPGTIMMSYLVDERRLSELKEVEFEAVLNYYNRNKLDSTVTVQLSPRPLFLDSIKIEPKTFRLQYGEQ